MGTWTACLTTIPPRFAQLPRVVESLRAQTRPPDRIVLTLPRRWRHFPGAPAPTHLPADITVLTVAEDLGPGLKLLGPLTALPKPGPLIACDDDWHYGPGWAAALLACHSAHPRAAITGSAFDAARIDGSASGTIAQGFSGLLLTPDMLAPEVTAPPPCAWGVDDIWLSAMLAYAGTPIVACPAARAQMTPLSDPDALQSRKVDGLRRAEANRAALAHARRHFGVFTP